MRMLDSLRASDASFASAEVVMVVDNVAEYYFRHDKEEWRLSDFPAPKLPFENMWVEYRWPSIIRSLKVGETNLETPGIDKFFGCFIKKRETGDFLFLGHYGYVVNSGANRGELKLTREYLCSIRFSPDGEVTGVSVSEDRITSDGDVAHYLYAFHPILMAFSFANCQNVEMVDVVAPAALQKARKRRGRPPISDFKVINIVVGATAKSSRRTEGTGRGDGVAVKIRRGHFHTYGEKYGRGKLFGKYEGRFWIPEIRKLDSSLVGYEVKKK